MTDGDQVLAAEPGFHGDPPEGGGWAAIAGRQLSGHYSELLELQPENGLALAQGPTATLRVVMKDSAGDATVETTARLMVEFMGGEFHRQRKVLDHDSQSAHFHWATATRPLSFPPL